MKDSDKKLYLVIWFAMTLLTVYLAILVAPTLGDSLTQTLDNVNGAATDPFNLKFCDKTGKTILFFLMAEFCVGAFWYSTRRKTRAGEEHGSAKLKNPSEVSRVIADKDFFKNRILSKNLRISVIGKAIKLSLNTLVIGGMGAGKSFFTLIPNLLQANTSFIATDPSGELAKMVGWFLKHIAHYDDVKIFDLENPARSAKYNFFPYIENEDDMLRIVNILFQATETDGAKSGSNMDPMWENMAKDYLLALIALLWYRGTEDEQNIETIIWLLEEDFLAEDKQRNRIQTPVMAMMEDLELRIPGNLASRAYLSATDGAVETIKGVKSTLRGRIGKFLLPSIQNLMSRDELDLKNIGNKKIALFLVVPSEDSSFNFIISMLYAQLFPILYRQARKQEDNRLPVPVQFLIDEMANFVLPKDFATYLTTSRKHAISFMMYIQEIAQMESIFPDKKFQTVTGTCNTVVYLGGSGNETNKFISQWLGSETITTYQFNRSYGRNASYSRNENLTKREVLNADEVDTKLSDNNVLVYVKGKGWYLDEKNDPTAHPNFQYTSGKEGEVFDWSGHDLISSKMQPLRRTADQAVPADIIVNLDKMDLNNLKEKLGIIDN